MQEKACNAMYIPELLEEILDFKVRFPNCPLAVRTHLLCNKVIRCAGVIWYGLNELSAKAIIVINNCNSECENINII